MKKYLVGVLKQLSLLKFKKMKRTEKFSYTFKISNTCKLEVYGTATQHPDPDEWEDTYGWEIDKMSINGIWLTDAMMEFINETYSNKMDEKLEEYIYDLFNGEYDESPEIEQDIHPIFQGIFDNIKKITDDYRGNHHEIFGEHSDMNPRFNHSIPEHGC